jgi:hypothetical protein
LQKEDGRRKIEENHSDADGRCCEKEEILIFPIFEKQYRQRQKMNSKQHIIAQLKPQYFWDVDLSKLNDTANKRLIIERVITLGTLGEIDLIINRYGRSEVIKVVQKISFDPKTLNFISKLFKIPKNDFTCYTRKPLKSRHWNL